MLTKHEQIIEHIRSLPIGRKISVRQTAKDLQVSEGTAYRAIKDAEVRGLVSTIERVGTIRIEQKTKDNFDKLTYAEVVNIVDGTVLGGKEGLYKTLSKFVIGAMQLDAMKKYVTGDSLLIVGNRTKAHALALECGAAILITGGFLASNEIVAKANALALPVISTNYDTFTVAALINRAIYDQLIRKDIVVVDDIVHPIEDTYFLNTGETVSAYVQKSLATGHGRFPVVDEQRKVIGVITSKDVLDASEDTLVDRLMTRNPITVEPNVSVASASRTMVWEGVELLPVVDGYGKLQGVISRHDVLGALQMAGRSSQNGETIHDLIISGIKPLHNGRNCDQFIFPVTPQMTDALGTLSYGVFTTIVAEATSRLFGKLKRTDIIIENMTIFFVKPVQMETELLVHPQILEIGRKFAKVEVDVTHGNETVGKALLMLQMIDD
ncbi:MAG: DRTGG domain-containing protein [Bacilli bacterium]